MQHARRIAHASGVHRHVDDLLFDPGCVTGVGGIQQEGASIAQGLLAAVSLLPLARRAMSDDICTLAVWAMQDLHDHDVTRWGGRLH